MNARSRTVDDVSDWWTYVQKHAGGETNAKIGERVGVTGPSVGRWAKGSTAGPAQAAEFARQYGRPVLEAFVAAGFLTPQEAGERPASAPSLTELDDDDLLEEVGRRMRRGGTDGATPEAGKKIRDVATGRQVAEKGSAPRS